ncbi:hypothetical protein V5O48_018346 [Marasmius crinis-equi]|uniref:Uncharacterized protein n=1 Tax=Marasmius crinis-equi TaxID=585013 RepID=A0ABR3ELF4_9AGAR
MSRIGCERTTRSGRVWASYIVPPDEADVYPVQVSCSIDSGTLLKHAFEREDENLADTSSDTSSTLPHNTEPCNESREGDESTKRCRKAEGEEIEEEEGTRARQARQYDQTETIEGHERTKRRRKARQHDKTQTIDPCERRPLETGLPEESHPKQSSANRRRCVKRQRAKAAEGHPSGHGIAFNKTVLPSEPHATGFDSTQLPFAQGAWIGVAPRNIPDAKTAYDLEDLRQKKFGYIAWNGRTSIPILDEARRVLVTLHGRPSDPAYVEAVGRVTSKVLKKRAELHWTPEETSHERGEGFPNPGYGISFGQGQQQPTRMKSTRFKLMEEFISDVDVQRVASFQSAGYALWYPRNYNEFRRHQSELLDKLPHLKRNFENSVFSAITINFGPQTCTHIHLDSMNVPDGCCAVTAGGSYDPKQGGHLILWDLRLVIEFPPGSTILLPSALIRHSNIPVRGEETRISLTQYTAGGIHRWLEYGGRTEKEMKRVDRKEYDRQMGMRASRWEVALARFSTLEELKAGVVA